jgi:hypothetical protein
MATTTTTTSPQKERGIRIAIDRGGTFTDCVGEHRGQEIIIKLLSEDPANYDDAPLEGIRRIMSHFLQRDIPRGEALDTSHIDSIRMGTTVATNALLERKGEKIAMVVTRGFRDCLAIGNQSRPKIFDLAIRKPDVLYEQVVEIDERVTLEDYAEDPERKITEADAQAGSEEAQGKDLVRGLSGETVRILRRPEHDDIRDKLQKVYDSGIRSIAVCLMHGYTFPDHEALIGRIAREIGFQHISLSHELMPMVKLVPRATSVCADAYLTPAIKKYINGFQAGFEGGLGTESVKHEKGRKGARCEFMQSDGGLVDVDNFTGLKAILSGPAGGVVGYAITSYDEETKIPVIGFDMVTPPSLTHQINFAASFFFSKTLFTDTTTNEFNREAPAQTYLVTEKAGTSTSLKPPPPASPSSRPSSTSTPSLPAAALASSSATACSSSGPNPPALTRALPATERAARRPSRTPTCTWAVSCPSSSPKSLAKTRTRASTWTPAERCCRNSPTKSTRRRARTCPQTKSPSASSPSQTKP